jgi:hypothetical protein
MKKNIYRKFIIFSLLVLYSIKTTFAVPPPDFIIQVASQLTSFFAILVAFFY